MTAPTPPLTGAVTPPVFQGERFTCPFCGAYAGMEWRKLSTPAGSWESNDLFVSLCASCRWCTVWRAPNANVDDSSILWPRTRGGIGPHAEMPEAARAVYEEARAVAELSPRASVALLRLALDVLLREVVDGAGAKPLDAVIGLAVKQGLTPAVWAAMESLRVIGNDAVHPKQLVLDETDEPAKITALCRLLNLIVEQLVSAPRLALQVFDTLPDSAKQGIGRRSGGLPSDP